MAKPRRGRRKAGAAASSKPKMITVKIAASEALEAANAKYKDLVAKWEAEQLLKAQALQAGVPAESITVSDKPVCTEVTLRRVRLISHLRLAHGSACRSGNAKRSLAVLTDAEALKEERGEQDALVGNDDIPDDQLTDVDSEVLPSEFADASDDEDAFAGNGGGGGGDGDGDDDGDRSDDDRVPLNSDLRLSAQHVSSRARMHETLARDLSDECIICLDAMSKGERITRLGCLCVFHSTCYTGWTGFSADNIGCPVHRDDAIH